MTDAGRKLVLSTIICYAVGFGILLLSSIFAFSEKETLSVFLWDWVFARTWGELLRLAPVAQAWAALLTFGWVLPMHRAESASIDFARFNRALLTLLVLSLIASATYLVVHPRLAARVHTLEFSSQLARSLLESAERREEEGDYVQAEADLNQYLFIVGDDLEAQQRLERVRQEAELDRASSVSSSETQPRLPENATAADLVDRATAADSEGDYSSAHYFAVLALAIDEDNSAAARLASEALSKLASLAPDEEEVEAAALFRRKQAAKALITRREYIEAFYQLRELDREYPRDPDIDRYLEIALEQVRALAVLIDEVEEALALPGVFDVVFVNRRTDTRTELVALGKLVQAPTGIYAQEVDVIEFTHDGRITYRLESNYAKVVEGHLALTVVNASGQPDEPLVATGRETRDNIGLLSLEPTPEQLLFIGQVFQHPSTASIGVLTRSFAPLERFGLIVEPLRIELLLRLSFPFAFMAFALVAVGFGWRFRSRYLHLPPVPTLLIIPVIPLLLLPLYAIFAFGQRLLVAASLLLGGFLFSVVVLIIAEAILMLLALFYVALASRK
ncbi:MAG: LptF/LptG family permease [Spirochaetales bacterium]